MLSIGEFARASGLTAKALRRYDELKLLPPAVVDQSNGYRYYAEGQVEKAHLVARLRSAGVPLGRIAAIIGASTPAAAADQVLSYWRQVEDDRASAREVIASLVALLSGQDNAVTPSTAIDIGLADLIAGLYRDLPTADDLTRTAEAGLRAQALTDLGERLIDHFVNEAKLGGATWSEIRRALAASGEAPGRRPLSSPFERFTDLNRHSIVLAQEAARAHHHDLIGTEHLLLGLLAEPKGLAHEVLTTLGRSEQDIRDAVESAMERDPGREHSAVGAHPVQPGQQGCHRTRAPRVLGSGP